MALYDDVNKQFEPQRQRAQQQINAQTQQARDAITRRAAQLGGGPSGAAIAQEQQAIQAGGQQLEQANQAVDSQVQAETQRQREVAEGRAFTTSERMGSQDFAGTQAALQRKFQTGERMGSQDFAHGERLGTQGFQTGEREAGQKFATSERLGTQGFQTDERMSNQAWQSGERLGQQEFAAGESQKGRDWQGQQNAEQRSIQLYGVNMQDAQFRAQLAQQGAQFSQSLAHEIDVDEFNKGIASKLANQKDLLERILGPTIGAFEGLGVGGGGGGSWASGLGQALGGVGQTFGFGGGGGGFF